MRRGRMLILIALVLLFGAAALYLVLKMVGGGGGLGGARATPESPDRVKVVIAAQDIARGSAIPENGVIVSDFPADSVVETMVTDKNQVIERIARQDIARGVPITKNMITEEPGDLLPTGSTASLSIPKGFTAISVPMTRLSGVAYAVRDGDKVDVLVSMLMIDVDQDFQSVAPSDTLILLGQDLSLQTGLACKEIKQGDKGLECVNEVAPVLGRIETVPDSTVPLYLVPKEDQRPRLVSQRLISNATVLHVGTFLLPAEEEAGAAAAAPQGAGAPTEGQTTTPTIKPPDVVTLIVTPQEALALNWATRAGVDIALTLRAPNDTTEDRTTSVTLQYMVDTYRITVPTKLPYSLDLRLEAPLNVVLPNDKSAPPAN
jgi:Flp pilus assembly protein CpaB